MFIVAVVLLPLSLGRTIIIFKSWFFSSGTTQILSLVTPMTKSTLLLASVIKNASAVLPYFSLDSYGVGTINTEVTKIQTTEIPQLDKASESFSKSISASSNSEQMDGTRLLSDDATIFIGYMVLLSFLLLYLGTVYLMRYARGEPLTMQRFSGTTFVLSTIMPLVKKISALSRLVVVMVYRHFLTMVKVAFILGIKVGMFPLMCGWWLDVCTLRMFGQTIAGRVKLFVGNPLGMSLAYWLAGNFYLLCVFIYVSRIQEVYSTP